MNSQERQEFWELCVSGTLLKGGQDVVMIGMADSESQALTIFSRFD